MIYYLSLYENIPNNRNKLDVLAQVFNVNITIYIKNIWNWIKIFLRGAPLACYKLNYIMIYYALFPLNNLIIFSQDICDT